MRPAQSVSIGSPRWLSGRNCSNTDSPREPVFLICLIFSQNSCMNMTKRPSLVHKPSSVWLCLEHSLQRGWGWVPVLWHHPRGPLDGHSRTFIDDSMYFTRSGSLKKAYHKIHLYAHFWREIFGQWTKAKLRTTGFSMNIKQISTENLAMWIKWSNVTI